MARQGRSQARAFEGKVVARQGLSDMSVRGKLVAKKGRSQARAFEGKLVARKAEVRVM